MSGDRAMQFLRQSTAAAIMFGPLIDFTNGNSTVTNWTPAAASINLIKNPGAAAIDISGRTITHVASGTYSVALLSGDLDTLGLLNIVAWTTAVMRPVNREFMVIPQSVYDAMIAGTLKFAADVQQVNTVTVAAVNLSQAAQTIVPGTVQTGSTTTAVKTNLASATNSMYVGRIITFVTGALAGQSSSITAYAGGTATLTVAALTGAPANGDTFVIV